MFVSFQLLPRCLCNPDSQSDSVRGGVFERELGHEWGALFDGISALTGRGRENLLLSFLSKAKCEDTRRIYLETKKWVLM